MPSLRKLKFGRVKKMHEGGFMMLAVALTQCPRLQEWDMDSKDEFLVSDYEGEHNRPWKIMQALQAILRTSGSEEDRVTIRW